MSAGSDNNNVGGPGWLTRLFRSVGLLGGLAAGASSVAAQGVDYRPAAAAPAAWQEFAKRLQSRFQQRLAADDEGVRQFQDYMAKRAGAADTPSLTLVVRTWILPDGKIERIEFDGLDDPAAAVNLRALLAGGDVGTPPPDMLQPLRLRLSLRPKDQPRRGD